jgi:hypothetical protein
MNQEPRVYRVGDTVKANGTSYEIVHREGDAVYAIYQEFGPKESSLWNCEKWIVRRLKADRPAPSGSVQPAGTEYLPSSSSWGELGWTIAIWARNRLAAVDAVSELMGKSVPEYGDSGRASKS